jgi:hypothetical protein
MRAVTVRERRRALKDLDAIDPLGIENTHQFGRYLSPIQQEERSRWRYAARSRLGGDLNDPGSRARTIERFAAGPFKRSMVAIDAESIIFTSATRISAPSRKTRGTGSVAAICG